MGYIEDVAAAKARLNDATKAYTASVKEAERLEKQARKDYDKAVKDAEKALDACQQGWAKPRATFGKLNLFATRVANASASLSILGEVDARVDTSGNIYSHTDVSSSGGGVSLTGAVVGGLVAGAPGAIIGSRKKNKVKSKNETHDERKLFITVTTPEGQLIEEGDASKEREAREFAAKIINQSKVAAAEQERHEEEVFRLTQAVLDTKADTSAVDAAAEATQAARNDTAAKDEAQRLLDETRASGTEEEKAALEAKEHKARQTKRYAIAAAAAVVLLVILFSTHIICFHKWQEATCTDPQTCSTCGRTKGEALGHEWKEATCTDPKTCDRCGKTEGEALGHDVKEWEVTKKSSCTEKGQKEGVCTRCGKKQTRETKLKNHAFGDWTVTKEASCTEEGTRVRTCQTCGKEEKETIGKTDHTPGDWVVVQEPSVTALGNVNAGVRTRSCTVCGAELDREDYTIELTTGQKNALAKAASYLSFTSFSYSGLVDQLKFEGFSDEDSVFAADHCGADWNEQAALKAQSYLEFMSFSRQGLIDQLLFEGFTYEQAEYGVSAVGY